MINMSCVLEDMLRLKRLTILTRLSCVNFNSLLMIQRDISNTGVVSVILTINPAGNSERTFPSLII